MAASRKTTTAKSAARRKARRPAAAQVEEDTQGLEWARCRALGHSWRHNAQPVGGEDGVIGFTSSCSFCGTQRTKWISRRGVLGPLRYEHPANYARHGDSRLTTLEWRTTFIVTVFGD